jgi:NitT/TauT family transport system substrate-binding protein
MVLARASGLALSAVLVFNVSAGADMLLVRPQIATLSQLKGKRIGLEDSNLASVMVSAVLEQAGLRNTDVTLVRLSNDLHAKAWQQKSVDALITYEPVASVIQGLGAQKLFDSRQIPNVIVDVLAVHQEALDRSYKTALTHAVNAHFRGLNHLQRSPQDAAYRMSEHLKLPAAEVLSAFKGLLLPDVVAGYHLLGGTAPALLDSARKLSALMVRGGQLAKADSLDKLLTNQYLPSDI